MSAKDVTMPEKSINSVQELNLLISSKGRNSKQVPKFGVRHKQVILLFLLVFMFYSMRINLSITIVAMTDPTSNLNPDVPTYNWTDKSIILSAFLWTYGLPQLGAGWLVNFYGPKWFLVGGMLASSFCSIMTVYMARTFGSKGVMSVRAVQGLVENFLFPSIHAMLSKWAPSNERSRLCTYVYAGPSLGMVVSTSLSGIIAASWYGWPMSYYCFGSVGLASGLLFASCGYNTPEDHGRVSVLEKKHIQGNYIQSETKKIPTPWRKILSSGPVWGIAFAQSGCTFGYWTMVAQTPLYLNKIMKFNIESNGLLSALPYLVDYFGSFLVSYSADYLINRKILSIGTTRKTCTTLGSLVPTIAFVYLANCNTGNVKIAVCFLILSISGYVFIHCGFIVNHLDISRNHTGTVMGLTNGISNIVGLLSPLSVQFIVKDEANPAQWGKVFYIAAFINVFGCLVYSYLGSGEIQEWDNCKTKSVPGNDLAPLRNVPSEIA